MKRTLSRILTLTTALVACAAFAACGDDNDIAPAQTEEFAQGDLVAGTYDSARCFKNKVATAAALADRFSIAQVILNEDRTATATFQMFTDAACTAPAGTENLTFTSVGIQMIGTVALLRFEQAAGVIDPVWLVPVAPEDDGYQMDLDFTDGNSGPYLLDPAPADLEEFRVNPAGEGVFFEQTS